MTVIEVVIAKHEERIEHMDTRLARIEDKIDKLYLWLVGLMGGIIASLILLVINIGARR